MRFLSSTDPFGNDWTESVGDRRFLSSRSGGGAYWTETRDLTLRAEAARTAGVVTTSTLHSCGFSEPATRAAVRRGLLTRWGRGIYVVGPLTSPLTEARAALAAVPHGVLGFEVAAQLARIAPIAAPPVDVLVPSDRRPRPPGVAVHRIDLLRRDITRLEDLPATTPAVT